MSNAVTYKPHNDAARALAVSIKFAPPDDALQIKKRYKI